MHPEMCENVHIFNVGGFSICLFLMKVYLQIKLQYFENQFRSDVLRILGVP